jgi:hypothetical protein
MNIKKYIIAAFATLTFMACSNIDEDDRLIYVKPAAIKRSVLLEDFTGQRCINCPMANDEIKLLQEQYGEDNVIAVSIHSGPLGFHTTPKFAGLSTDIGDEYFNYWKLDYQPVGMIDRRGACEYTTWNTRIREELEKTAPVNINLVVTTEGSQKSVQANVTGVDGNITGKLQLWLTEDNVTAFQMMPDGTRDMNYLHQHVLRAAINGTWGEDISIKEGETSISQIYSLPTSSEWKAEDLSVIAFVYNEQGVHQVVRLKL